MLYKFGGHFILCIQADPPLSISSLMLRGVGGVAALPFMTQTILRNGTFYKWFEGAMGPPKMCYIPLFVSSTFMGLNIYHTAECWCNRKALIQAYVIL